MKDLLPDKTVRKGKYYLGLDMGVSSVGWAIMVENEDGHHFLHDFGVRIFDAAEERGGETKAQKRRQQRSQRRLIRRRSNRIKRVQLLLIKNQFIKTAEEFLEQYKKKSTNKIEENNGFFSTQKNFWNPFVLRSRGLRSKLDRSELCAVLVHFCKKRGYLDRSLAAEEGELGDKGKRKSNSKSFSGALEKGEEISKGSYISDAVLNRKDFRIGGNNILLYTKNGKHLSAKTPNQNDYRFLFSRETHKIELKAILEQQSKHYPELERISKRILDIVFLQRDFEVGPKCRNHSKKCNPNACSDYKTFNELVGKCSYYPDEKRGFKSSLTFSAYFFVEEISKFLAFLKKREIEFSDEIHKEMLKGFLAYSWGKKELKDLIKETPDWRKSGDDSYFKVPMWAKKEGMNLNKALFLKEIRKILPLQEIIEKKTKQENFIEELNENLIEKLGGILNRVRTRKNREKEVKNLLIKHEIKVSDESIKNLIKMKNENTTSAKVSFRHMLETIKLFWNGKIPKEVLHKKEPLVRKEKGGAFQKITDPELQTNPIVLRAVNQARKILKVLVKKYKFFYNINIEVGSEIAKNWKDRKKIQKRYLSNEKKNEEIKEELYRNNLQVNESNSLALKLWKEQEEQCLYCGKLIPIQKIAPALGSVEIDHIIPVSSNLTDDSFQNKALVCISCNQKKRKKIPLQFMEENDKKRFVVRVEKLRKKISWKKYDYLMTKADELAEKCMVFASRDLNDNRYIAKWFSAYVKQELKKISDKSKVLAIPGRATSMFRRKWLFNSAWGLEEKVRDITHFHHAVDAMIISQFKGQFEIELAIDLIRLGDQRLKIKRIKNEKEKVLSLEKHKNFLKEVKNKWQRRQKVKYFKVIDSAEKNNNFIEPFYIKDLKTEVENRIPVILKMEMEEKKCSSCEKVTKEKVKKCSICLGIERTPKFQSLLSEEEWKKKNENKKTKEINLRYPLVSYMTNYKVKRTWASDTFGVDKKDKKEYRKWRKKSSLVDNKKAKKFMENTFENKHGNILLTDKYYGISILDKLNWNWERRINLIRRINKKKRSGEKINFLRERPVLVRGVNLRYWDVKTKTYITKKFSSRKQEDKIYIHPNQLVATGKHSWASTYISKETQKEVRSAGHESIHSIQKSPSLEIVKIDILGNCVKKKLIK